MNISQVLEEAPIRDLSYTTHLKRCLWTCEVMNQIKLKGNNITIKPEFKEKSNQTLILEAHSKPQLLNPEVSAEARIDLT